MPKSYYEMICDLITETDRLYDRVGGLRDAAANNEKQAFNAARTALASVAMSWREFRDQLPADRAEMLLPGWHDEK